MKKIKNLFKGINLEYVWMGGEFLLIYFAWEMTGNLPFILAIKLFSILFSEEIFHEEIEGKLKRVFWHIISFLGYIVAFSLNHTGYVSYGVSLTIYIGVMGAILLRIGSFHHSSEEDAF